MVDRFLQHLEIEAREPGLLRKGIRKMRAHPIITGSAAAILLCAGVGTAAVNIARRQQRGSIDLLVTSASDHRKVQNWSALQLDIDNHPTGGPVLSGPHLQPWICTTQNHGLGAPLDADCNAPTQFTFFFKSGTTGQFIAYDPANPPPAPIATIPSTPAATAFSAKRAFVTSWK